MIIRNDKHKSKSKGVVSNSTWENLWFHVIILLISVVLVAFGRWQCVLHNQIQIQLCISCYSPRETIHLWHTLFLYPLILLIKLHSLVINIKYAAQIRPFYFSQLCTKLIYPFSIFLDYRSLVHEFTLLKYHAFHIKKIIQKRHYYKKKVTFK